MNERIELNGQRGNGPSTHRKKVRWFVRIACLILAVVVLMPARDTRWPVLVPALSPLVAVTSILAARALHAMVWLGLAVGLVMLWRPRWFCRWVCPLGLCADGTSHLGRRLRRRSMSPIPLGQWIVWLTLGGAFVGYPVLLWLDPLAMFTSLFRWAGPGLKDAAMYGVIPGAAVLVFSFLWPHVWCGHICPLGALQDLLSRAKRRLRNIRRRADAARPSGRWDSPLPRRALLGVVIGAASAAAVRLTRVSVPRPLRPPGAIDEAKFPGLCVRCGNCVRACPTQIIEPDLGHHGLASLLSPVLRFERGYCREDCVQCTAVCPSGALVRLSIEEKAAVRIGLPRVDMGVCLLGDDQECSECKRWCPYDAIRYVFSEAKYTLIPEIDPKKCTGCGACEVACPTKPKKAIVVVADPTWHKKPSVCTGLLG